ncbi:MAG: MMPL family transporter [Flavobacteriia bacterium]|nr:MMPL family transporter [Flavobacteriia bacterium]
MWQKIANIILRNRLFILAILLIITVFLGYFAFTGLKIDNKYGNTLPKNSEAQKNYLDFKTRFGEDGSTLVIAIQDKDFYTEEKFRTWKEIGDSILQIDGVLGVISEATLFTLVNNKTQERFDAKRVFSDVSYKEKSIDSIKNEIKNNPIYKNILYNPATGVSLMMVKMDEKFLSNQKTSKVVLTVENIALNYEKEFGKMHFAGLPHIRIVVGKRILNEMYFFIGLSILVTSIILYLFFKSFRVVFICNSVVFVSVIWSMGTIGLFGYHISILMALIPPLMIVISIPNCVFLMTKYHQEVKKHGNKIKALAVVISKIGLATFLTNFTTAMGFSTFIFTNSQRLIEFGVIASINILLVFFISITIIPIITTFSKSPKTRHLKHLDRKIAQSFLDKLVYLIQFKRKWIYITCLVLVAISVVGIFKMKATGNVTGDLPPGDPILKDVHFIEKNFGGAIPFEILINYKKPGRLFKNETLEKIEKIQDLVSKDTLFSKSLSYVDFVKVINMAYYGNDSTKYRLLSNRDKKRLKKYIDNFDWNNSSASNMSIKELIDTTNTTLRVRTQMKDLGSYQVNDYVQLLKLKFDQILNPDKSKMNYYLKQIEKNKQKYIDSLFEYFPSVYNNVTEILSSKNTALQYEFDSNPEKIKTYYKDKNFKHYIKQAVNDEFFEITLTGTSVVVSEGTMYLVKNLFTSILFAIISISILMALLFRSFRMVLVSMIPNLIPLVMTAGIMGWFQIPLKPSTLLIFSIALGISVDDTIHFLSKYRLELKTKKWNLKECILISIKESGIGMFYTSIILFFGFSVLSFSQFGGTKALGMLISITLLIAMLTNLIVLPSILLSLDRLITTKSFEEPYFEVYDEDSDINWDDLEVKQLDSNNEFDTDKPDN